MEKLLTFIDYTHTYRKITHIVIATELLIRVPKSHIGEKRQSL